MSKIKKIKKQKQNTVITMPKVSQEAKNVSLAILLVTFLFAFYIRAIVPFKAVFSNNIVAFAMDDSVYQMRLVENTIANFPTRIFYDAYTLFPYGDSPGWGILYTLIVSIFSMITSFITGMSIQDSIGLVGALTPAVIGSLLIFPVFFIGKELSGYKAGLLGAFLVSIMPGQLLSRSILGFSDHHILETFLVTLTMLFLIIALRKSKKITLNDVRNKDWSKLKVPFIYSLFTGISLGSYLLTWVPGILFVVIITVFFAIQFILLYYKNESTDHLAFVGIILYLVTMILLLPVVDIKNGFASTLYSLLHIIITGGSALLIAYLGFWSIKLKNGSYSAFHYAFVIVVSATLCLIIANLIAPAFIASTIGNWNYVFVAHTGGSLTIAEGMPTFTPDANNYLLSAIIALFIPSPTHISYFGNNYIIAHIALLFILYLIITKAEEKFTLLLIWSMFVVAITLAQNRFAYYYAVNVSILSAFVLSKVMNYLEFNILRTFKDVKAKHVILTALVIFVIAFLPLERSPFQVACGDVLKTWSCTSTQSGVLSDGQYEWYESLTWMRSHTPELDVPYISIYEKPPRGTPYKHYSLNDYGVMSWWDYGHIITYWGHRIPNANPFQSGVGWAATFLTAPTEQGANELLKDIGINGQPGARYVVSNAYMAYSIQPVFAEWNLTNYDLYRQIRTSSGNVIVPTEKYFNTMESKLHIFDTNGLKNYRLIHESTPAPWFRGGNEEKQYKAAYNQLYNGNIPIEDSGYVKIFEYVKGAIISGNIPNSVISIEIPIKTNIGRQFIYSQTVTTGENGAFSFTVPYSTAGPITGNFECNSCFFPGNKGSTQFDTKPIEDYNFKVNSTIIGTIKVSELDVLKGNTLVIP